MNCCRQFCKFKIAEKMPRIWPKVLFTSIDAHNTVQISSQNNLVRCKMIGDDRPYKQQEAAQR